MLDFGEFHSSRTFFVIDDLMTRLDRVRVIGHEFGYGVGDDMDFLLSKYTLKSP